jgi:hypothetical protein
VKWLRGNPFFEFGRRPFREARLRSYIVRQHQAGRPLLDILGDPYVARCGSEQFCWSVLQDPQTLAALRRNDGEALARLSRELERDRKS